MKHKPLLILALTVGLNLSQTVFAEENQASSVDPAIQTLGWAMAKQAKQLMDQLDFSKPEVDAFLQGFNSGLSDDSEIESQQEKIMSMQQYLNTRMMEQQEKMAAEQESINEDFFAELAANETIQKSDSGLFYEIIEAGDETRANDSDSVTLHYHGSLIDGTVFDSSVERGEPATFGVANVVPGFSEGVKLIGNGGKVKLYIPPALGYRDRPTGSIPPNSTLIFEVEMISIDKAPASEVEEMEFEPEMEFQQE